MSYWVTYAVNMLVQSALIIFAANETVKLKKSFFGAYFCILSVCAFLNVMIFAVLRPPESESILSTLQSLCIFVIIVWLTEGKWRQKLRSLTAVTAASLLTELTVIVIVRAVYGVDTHDLGTADKLETVISILALELYYTWTVLVVLLFRIRDESFRRMRSICLISALVAVFFSAISIFYNTNGADKLNRQDVFINQMTHCMITVLLIVLYYAMKHSVEKTRDEERLAGMESYIQQTREFYELAERRYEETAKIRHDIRNQVQTVEYLIAENDIEESRKSLEVLREKYSEVGVRVYSDVPAVNVVMSLKLNECAENGIAADVMLSGCKALPFDNYELCSIFSNIMDNAIRAARDSGSGHISVKSKVFGENFILKCENTVPDSGKPQKRSRKGYGLDIIRSIVRKYDGTFSTDISGGTFTALMTMPVGQDEQKNR
ncbi:MAG: GHKL domain-containing protein [Ruminococcus sp.]|nr:GHKL domain-containing protein [Ruminococcus sp.]